MDYQQKIKEQVSGIFNEKYVNTPTTPDDFYVVWFCKTLDNYKALVSTDFVHGYYVEVTHNGAKNETYVDVYIKDENVLIEYVAPKTS
ncbi:hypothetical protein SEA_FEDE_50 [Microbacterium phage Fede]|nr:hypothetical protein SEA_FEDE_50 [Microbacterium phage Fede]